MEKKFDVHSFAMGVEELVVSQKMDYMDAIVAFGEQNSIELEVIAALVKKSEPIRAKLEAQCRDANLLKSGDSLSLEAFAQ